MTPGTMRYRYPDNNRSSVAVESPSANFDVDSGFNGRPSVSRNRQSLADTGVRHSDPALRSPNPVTDAQDTADRSQWEYHSVSLHRVPGYGFGIAVSGGRDNPHFANGDPAIAISDVLKAGPAEQRLLVNDRVLSANGISLENVEYSTAVQVLRECGNTVNLVIKRKVAPPAGDAQNLRVTLTKNKKRDDFGIVLGCRIYIKEVSKAIVEREAGVQEGDVVSKINNTPTDGLSLKEAKKLVESSRERLQLTLRREKLQQQTAENRTPGTGGQNKEPLPSFPDLNPSRDSYAHQNVYVQPPTRSDSYDKNNLTRMTGRSRGPLLDISLSQLDQPSTPIHFSGEEAAPPRPPPPRAAVNDGDRAGSPSRDVYGTRRDAYGDDPIARRNKPVPDPRYVSFQKEGSVGIRLTGGNDVGIFVTAVQPGSPASLQGLQPGDKILKVNEKEMKGVTREEAFTYLLGLQERIDLIVQHRKEEYDSITANQRGDSFYIRTHFGYDPPNKGEMSFRPGDIFHVVDTLYGGSVGSWQAFRISHNNQETQKGVIPNKGRAEELATAQFNAAKTHNATSSSESRGNFFKRRSARRTKSLGKEHWDDVVFGSEGVSKFPAYEKVTLKHPGFIRPVIFFGPTCDVARDRLLKENPDKFASPQIHSQYNDVPKSQKSSTVVRLSAIKEIIERSKHCLLDVTPNTVDRLNYAQFYPIVIFLRADGKHIVKELRSHLAKGVSSHKSSKKLYDESLKLEKAWSHIFTATVTLSGAETWLRKLKDMIEQQQQTSIWMSESQPLEPITDDFLFPMTSRLSYASSPESDLDLSPDPRRGAADFRMGGGRASPPRMTKASSDPSIATQEDSSLPIYQGPPPYSPPYSQRADLDPYNSRSENQKAQPEEDGFYPGTTEDSRSPYYRPRGGMDPYGSLPHSTAGSSYRPPPPPANPYDPYGSGKRRQQAEPESPPKIDRASKPTRFRSAQDRLFGHQVNGDMAGGSGGTPNYINTKPSALSQMCTYDTAVYNGGETFYPPSSPGDQQHVAQSRTLQQHDPYRFTRSTQPPQPSARTTYSKPPPPDPNPPYQEFKPPPPPKNPPYKPVPPPKPKNYRSPTGQEYWARGDEYQPYHHGFSQRVYEDDSAGFDSGQGSSLDRNYDRFSKASPAKNGYYYNVPPPRGGEPAYHHARESSGLDLSNRENRGSAFELYKKPPSMENRAYIPHDMKNRYVTFNELISADDNTQHPLRRTTDDGRVVATARGWFDHNGGVLDSPETGVSVVIPAGALPVGAKEEVYFNVCQDENVMPPLDQRLGEQLLSPVVMCGPTGLRFLKPVELRLPHQASAGPKPWAYALKTGDNASPDSVSWRQVSLNDENTRHQPGSESVSVLVDHF